jgi:hypothetical protein
MQILCVRARVRERERERERAGLTENTFCGLDTAGDNPVVLGPCQKV